MALTAIVEGGVDTGWTFYAPFSTTYSNTHVILAAIGVFVAGFSSILTGLNFIVTIHKMRAPGHDLVAAAAVRVGALCHQPDPGAGNAGDRHHPGAAGAGARSARRHLRPEPGRRSGPVPASVLVLLASRPSTS